MMHRLILMIHKLCNVTCCNQNAIRYTCLYTNFHNPHSPRGGVAGIPEPLAEEGHPPVTTSNTAQASRVIYFINHFIDILRPTLSPTSAEKWPHACHHTSVHTKFETGSPLLIRINSITAPAEFSSVFTVLFLTPAQNKLCNIMLVPGLYD